MFGQGRQALFGQRVRESSGVNDSYHFVSFSSHNIYEDIHLELRQKVSRVLASLEARLLFYMINCLALTQYLPCSSTVLTFLCCLERMRTVATKWQVRILSCQYLS